MTHRRFAAFFAAVLVSTALACSDGPDDTGDSTVDAGDVTDVRQTDISNDTSSDTATDSAGADVEDSDTGTSPDVMEDVPTLAEGISVQAISAYQTVQTRLVQDGAAADSDIPLVVGRDTLVQVRVATQSDWTQREVTAELALTDAGDSGESVLTDTRLIRGTSTPDDRSTSFHFLVDGASLTSTTSASVRLLGDGPVLVDDTTESTARWPNDGSTMPLDATDETGTLQLVLVPFRYNADGSARMPDTSDTQLQIIEDALLALYPAVELRLSVRDPVDWSGYADFGDINRELRDLKRQDGATYAYYYGMIRPDETFADYCSGTCTTGQSFTVSSASAASYRVGSGVGFSGERWAWTLVHELGHMHGRGHAPCDVSWWSDDDNYPHSGGIIGVNAWDGRDDRLLGPDDATDFMGYCDNLWASDYTYMGIFERMAMANSLQEPMALGPKQAWRYVNWSEQDDPAWGRTTHERTPYSGEWATATFLGADDSAVEQRRIPFVRYSHEGARSVLLPSAPPWAERVRIVAESRDFTLAIR